jgi:hypothetical protein
MLRVPAIISGNEDRLTPEVVADLSKDYGPQWSDKKPTAKAAKETSNDAIGSAEGERTGNRARQAHTYRNRAARGRRRFMRLLHVSHGLSYGLYLCIYSRQGLRAVHIATKPWMWLMERSITCGVLRGLRGQWGRLLGPIRDTSPCVERRLPTRIMAVYGLDALFRQQRRRLVFRHMRWRRGGWGLS